MEKEQNQGYFYIIPAKLAEEGKPIKALLYGLIVSLVNKEGYCWSSNKFLAKKLGRKDDSIIVSYLSELEREGWIKRKIEKDGGNKRKIWIIVGENGKGLRKNPQRSTEKSADPSTEKSAEVVASKRVESLTNKEENKNKTSQSNINNSNIKEYNISEIKDFAEKPSLIKKEKAFSHQLVDYFFELKGWADKDKDFYQKKKIVYSRFTKPSKELLILCEQNLEKAKKCLKKVRDWANSRQLDWGIDTALKKWYAIDTLEIKEIVKIPYYRDMQIAEKWGRKWCIPNDGGNWMEFNDSEDKIEYK